MSSDVLRTISCCTYLTSTDNPWRPDDYVASKGVKLLKGDIINGYFDINLRGTSTRITNSNATVWVDDVVPKRMAKYLKEAFPEKTTLVPIPNSNVTRIEGPDFKTLKLAAAIAVSAGSNYDVCPALVFKEQQVSSRKGGPRNPFHCEQAYKYANNPFRKVVLIDDVLTSGSHLIGATWKLKAKGIEVVGALTFGKSTGNQIEPVFAMHEGMLTLSKVEPSF